MVRSCSWCGEPLEFKGGNHKYCNSCRVIVRAMSLKKAKKRYNNKKKLQSLVAKGITNIKSCENCGAPFEINGGNHRYCTICIVNIRKENLRSYYSTYYYKRLKNVRRSDVLRPTPMGTGCLSGNPKSDFKEEYEVIQREFTRLGISYR